MNNTSCTLYIVRHGETEWNVNRHFQGQKDSPLTVNGIAKIKERAEHLRNVSFDAAFSSDLLRAKKTAEILALEYGLAVQTSELLRERHYGAFEGEKIEEIKKEFSHLFDSYNALSQQEKFTHKYVEGMESYEDIAIRFVTFLREVSVLYSGKTVLVVCHGTIMSAFLVKIGFVLQDKIRVENTGYFILLSDGIDFFVKETEGIHML